MVKKTLSQHPAERRALSRRQTCLQSREDFTRANTEDSPQAANKARLNLDKKHLKKPEHFWKSILWTADIKINLHQNDWKKKVWRRLEQLMMKAHSIICETRSSVIMSCMSSVALGYCCLAGSVLKCIEIDSLPRFS